ncbi:hypothetical protein LUZ60_012411 [Juncus effusus]|nr:hypothetical protein LUZ60_012411 [Juncus effusus]
MARPLLRSLLLSTSFLHHALPLPRSSPSPSPPRFRFLSERSSSARPSALPVRRGIAGRTRRRGPVGERKKGRRMGPPELDVAICLEEDLPDDPLITSIAEELKKDVPNAMKVAFESVKEKKYETRDDLLKDVNKFRSVEISVLLCDDDFIKKLNKEWRGEDKSTDVLSMSQHVPGLDIPVLLLGDIVISVETAGRQAKERDHSLLDEIRILMVHGLLHLLGFDHEISEEAEEEMGIEENRVLNSLNWKNKGLITSACDSIQDKEEKRQESSEEIKKSSTTIAHEPKLSHILFDIDSKLLNGEGLEKSAEALKEAINREIKIIIITGLSRNAITRALNTFNLGEYILSSPGVFLQGAIVYGRNGREIYKANLEKDLCKEAFLYSLENEVPLIAFCDDKCFTLFEHHLIDSFHKIYHEPKATIEPSIEHLLNYSVQKLLFLDSLKPDWSESIKGRANLVRSVPNSIELVPIGASKGIGVKMILDHLGIISDEFEIGEEGEKWLLD